MNIIDAHHHLWIPQQTDPDLGYGWLRDIGEIKPFGDPTPIQRDYVWSEYANESAQHTLEGSVYVQVDGAIANPVKEAAWVHSVFKQTEQQHAIVALCNLAGADAENTLKQLSSISGVQGIRHILSRQDDNPALSFAGEHFLQNAVWRENYALLKEYGFTFDLQLYPQQMKDAAAFFKQHPDTAVVVDHAGSPYDQTTQGLRALNDGLQLLAELPHVHIKLSGFGMFDANWSASSIQPIINSIVDAFGYERIMYGSNFPVDKLMQGMDYGIAQIQDALCRQASASMQRVFSENARQFYRIVN